MSAMVRAIMLKGSDLVVLVRDTLVSDPESHVGTLYEMRHEELSSRMSAAMGAYLGSLGSVALALFALDVAKDDPTKYVLCGAVVLVLGVFSTVLQNRQLARLRAQVGWAKDLTLRLVRVYR